MIDLIPPPLAFFPTDVKPASWFYDGWPYLIRVMVMGLLAYPTLIVMLRLSGKRTLSKMNAFDMTITIAFGSVLAAVLLNKSISYLEGTTAFAMLVLLQYAAAWLSARSDKFRHALKARPTILFWDGEFLEEVCLRERVAATEVRCAVRTSGYAEMGLIQAVVLETTGEMSVIPRSNLSADPPADADAVGRAEKANEGDEDERLTALLGPTNRAGRR